jgi:hypothetical protein
MPPPFSTTRRRAPSEYGAHPAVHNVLRRISAGQRALVSRVRHAVPTASWSRTAMVSHLIMESRLEIKIEKQQWPGAPLRNRTVDLLLTVPADFL